MVKDLDSLPSLSLICELGVGEFAELVDVFHEDIKGAFPERFLSDVDAEF